MTANSNSLQETHHGKFKFTRANLTSLSKFKLTAANPKFTTEVFRTSWKFEWGSRHIKFWHQNWHVGNRAYVIIAVRVTISVPVQLNIHPFMLLVIHYLKCGFRPVNFTSQNLMWRDPAIFTKFWKPLYDNSDSPRQIKIYHIKFKFTTANSDSLLQTHHIKLKFSTANLNSLRQFQIHHGKCKFSTGISNSPH